MIGYYIHHQGHGHLHRALAIQAWADQEITGLSSRARPVGWRGDWIQLVDDALPVPTGDPSVDGWLHYAPDHHDGLRARMAAISGWIAAAGPSCLVVDVSVEVALLARLHGVPILTMAQPGTRTDPVHTLGYGVSRTVVAPWPALAGEVWQSRVPRDKVVHVGAISRYAPSDAPSTPSAPRRVLVLNGSGGGGFAAVVARAREANPDWEWRHLGPSAEVWVDDPWPLLQSASVVVSHCGQNAVAEIAAARRPAVLIPQDRPFDEQRWLASALQESDWPALVLPDWPAPEAWPELLERAQAMDGQRWASWNDGGGARRTAALLSEARGQAESVPA